MRPAALLLGLVLAAQANGQTIVTSPAPDSLAVTIYRDPQRGTRPFNLQWLRGYALVSEIRRIRLPAGESEVRFEGVTSGIVPQSAIVTGLGEAVLEKNRDARLLSPGGLLDAHLGERLLLRRTSKKTGQVREQEAIVRATAEGIVLQTEAGIEALRCTGLEETLLARSVPAGLSATPTLSVRIRSPQPIEREVTLSYISNNFDWQADYVGELSRDGRRLSLFAWMTLTNGDDTGLSDASTQAVAGKLNRNQVRVIQGEASPIEIHCWPSQTTSDIPSTDSLSAQNIGLFEDGDTIVVTGMRRSLSAAAPPPPPPPAAPAMMAEQERLGDVRLYRIPISVTVAAKSQKQVAMIRQPAVEVETILRLRLRGGEDFEGPLPRVLVTRNEKSKGLGLPLPAGKIALFGTREGRRILVGEGQMDDHTIGEKVEIPVATATGVWGVHRTYSGPDGLGGYLLELSSDLPRAETVEVELPLGVRALSGGTLVKRDGWMLWRVRIPANGRKALRYRS